jgi:hypothetical protein
MLDGFSASEKVAARYFCPRCPPTKEAEQLNQFLEQAKVAHAKWERDRKDLLGHDCPPLQAKLFWCLKGEGPLTEEEVCELVYGVPSRYSSESKKPKWFQLSDRERKRLQNRLHTLQKELNDRLKKRKIKLRIVRPETGHLKLESLAPTTKSEPKLPYAASVRLEELLAKAGPYIPESFSPAKEWVHFLKYELRSGEWLGAVELQKEAKEKGCSPSKYRKALSLLPIERTCKRVAGVNRWYIRLRERAS